MTVRGRKGKFETVVLEETMEYVEKIHQPKRRFRIVETKGASERLYYHGEEYIYGEWKEIPHTKTDSIEDAKESVRIYGHRRVVNELEL